MDFNSWKRKHQIVFIIAASFAFVCFVYVLKQAKGFIWNDSGDIASWVQAIGSIATIYYSLKVSRRQMEDQRRNQKESEDRQSERQNQIEQDREKRRIWNSNIILLGEYAQIYKWVSNVLISINKKEFDWEAFMITCRITADNVGNHKPEEYPAPFDAVDMTSSRVFLEQIYQILMQGKEGRYKDNEYITLYLMLVPFLEQITVIKNGISQKIRQDSPPELSSRIEEIIGKIVS
ncbi:hypothetical protein I6G96_26845 [Delftia acidovorans]|uniref:hypothetical protein n=1 Tax=Delftia acidovorans TaxID=80866 RepID=UPI0018D82C56|nr:hypothetical protein [Delftia acidovorans]QPR34495.1 hypothetical protein I6G96_26845 [Delftia acidovorans]